MILVKWDQSTQTKESLSGAMVIKIEHWTPGKRHYVNKDIPDAPVIQFDESLNREYAVQDTFLEQDRTMGSIAPWRRDSFT
jgi:hypothetical protein